MAENESIAGVSVTVTGDLSGLGPSFSAAQSQAQAAGVAIAGSFNTGAASANQFTSEIDRLIVAIQQEGAASSLAAQRNNAMARSFQQIGQHAQTGGFSVRYMFLGLKDLAEGRSTFALAELSNELVRLGPAALAAGAAVALVVGPFVAYMHSMAEAAKITERGIDEVTQAIFKLNDVQQKLAIEGVGKTGGAAAGAGAQAADLEQQAKRIKAQIDDVVVAMNLIGRADRLYQRLTPGHSDVNRALITESEDQIKALLLEQEGLESRAKALREDQARLGAGEGGQLRSKNIEAAEQAAQRASQIAKQRSDAELALQHAAEEQRIEGLQSEQDRVTQLGQEEIRFEKAKQDEIAGYALATRDRAIKEIADKARAESAGKTRPEQALIAAGASADTQKARDEYTETTGKAALAVQQAEAKATLSLIELNRKAAETLRNDIVQGWDAVAAAARRTDEIVSEQIAKQIIAEQRVAEIEEAAKGKNAAELIGLRKIQLETQYGAQLFHTHQQEIDYRNAVAAIDDQVNTARLTGLAAELRTAEAVSGELRDEIRIADIKKQMQAESGQAQAAAASTAGQNATKAAQGSAGAQLQGTLTNALSGALSKGIMDGGKGIGRDITDSLKSAGQSLFKEAFDQIIIALIGNTIATEANTIVTAVKAFFGFADGTSSAPGGLSWVGERGPELMNVPRGAQIIPNHAIWAYASGTPGWQAATASSSSSSASFGDLHFHAHGVTDPRAFAEMAVREIPRVLKARGSQWADYGG